MRTQCYWLFAFVFVGMSAASAASDPADEPDWLKKMSIAAHRTDFSGVFIHQSGGNVEMSRITHVFDRDSEFERLEGADGEIRELLRNNDQVWLYEDGRKFKVERRQLRQIFPALLPEQLATLKENYLVILENEEQVAGYPAHAVVFQPRDNLRYTRKMWAHNDTGLLLKAVVLDDRGYIVEQYAFVNLSINGKIDRKWISKDKFPSAESTRQLRHSSISEVEPLVEPCGWQVDAMPAGFKKILEMRRPFHASGDQVIQLVYSDGLSGISVFIEKNKSVGEFHSELAGLGAAHVYNRKVGDSLVTVVGEVPARTVIQIADSVRYAGR